jgi:curved DNA-binding protein CbpA
VFEDHSEPKTENWSSVSRAVSAPTYYTLLDLAPGSSVREIRRAYREKSKLYHPDTTLLPIAIAQEQFHRLNEAYATLTSPERRLQYDRQIGFSSIPVVQPAPPLRSQRDGWRRSYLDPSDRPLSSGEMFALFILGLTLIGCLVLAVLVGLSRGEIALKSSRPLLQSLQQPQPIVSAPSAKNNRDQTAPPSPASPKLSQRSTLFHAHTPYESSLSPVTRNPSL